MKNPKEETFIKSKGHTYGDVKKGQPNPIAYLIYACIYTSTSWDAQRINVRIRKVRHDDGGMVTSKEILSKFGFL